MTLAADLAAALPRGVHVEHRGAVVLFATKHANGPHLFTLPAGPVDDVLVEAARMLRIVVEQRGPIAATMPGEA